MIIEEMKKLSPDSCPCGRPHVFDAELIIGEGVLSRLPEALAKRNIRKVFLLADVNTWKAAGEKVYDLLTGNGFEVKKFVFRDAHLEPNDYNVGTAVMNFDTSCDGVVSVGSGVLNDIGKILSNLSGKTYCIVGTAPSMDGYASATSSMTVDGLKTSVPSKCPDIILGDIDVIAEAPMKMMVSGLGDMLAKYVSICEWRIAHIITGEYYCEEVASLVRKALKTCVENADGLLARDKKAVTAVMEGLVLCGAAMKFAGVSRPASGVEHYISHIFDMRAEEFKTPADFHGIQCAMGTLIAVKLYEKLVCITPDREKALQYVRAFDLPAYHESLRGFLGRGAESMIALEKKEGKYDPLRHEKRLDIILSHWEDILSIVREELPASETLDALLDKLGAPKKPSDIGIDDALLPRTFAATRDIRDKYVLSRLAFDLGIEDLTENNGLA